MKNGKIIKKSFSPAKTKKNVILMKEFSKFKMLVKICLNELASFATCVDSLFLPNASPASNFLEIHICCITRIT